ncbi:MAG: M18 family aminopeptidase [Clostridia bacterium]|nr:M18 family aminopeptidase [Clostridia bacterium]
MNRELFDFIKKSPTAYHAADTAACELSGRNFIRLREGDKWELCPRKGYFVTRNGSSLIAFKIPKNGGAPFMISASHGDSPSFKIKENPDLTGEFYTRLSTEKYGGMLCAPWLDRPLAVAGRITVKTDGGIAVRLVDTKEPCALIPNVAVHMNRKANEGTAYNAAVDMLPLFGDGGASFGSFIARTVGVDAEDIYTTDLFLYVPEEGKEWNGYISAPRLDDLQCAFASLKAFSDAEPCGRIPVFCLFDNEEVGSETKQGAASTFLFDTLSRICEALGTDLRQILPESFLVSCDNAHAVHPNHPELSDKNHSVYMNGGVVIKYNANQKYTSDAVSAGIFRLICEKAGVPVQYYANRADLPGGSTLGSIANTKVSLNTVDMGAAQLAMHSAFETAGAKDTEYLYRSLKAFFESSVSVTDGGYKVK